MHSTAQAALHPRFIRAPFHLRILAKYDKKILSVLFSLKKQIYVHMNKMLYEHWACLVLRYNQSRYSYLQAGGCFVS